MKLADTVVRLLDQLPRADRRYDERVRRALDNYNNEQEQDRALVRSLIESWAGLVEVNGPDPKGRLASPRLRTTPRNERRQTITRRSLEYTDLLQTSLTTTVENAIKLAMCEYEIEQEDRRDQACANAKDIKTQLGLYAEVAVAAQTLFDRFGVDYRHWAALRDDDLCEIAAILLRKQGTGDDLSLGRSM